MKSKGLSDFCSSRLTLAMAAKVGSFRALGPAGEVLAGLGTAAFGAWEAREQHR